MHQSQSLGEEINMSIGILYTCFSKVQGLG